MFAGVYTTSHLGSPPYVQVPQPARGCGSDRFHRRGEPSLDPGALISSLKPDVPAYPLR